MRSILFRRFLSRSGPWRCITTSHDCLKEDTKCCMNPLRAKHCGDFSRSIPRQCTTFPDRTSIALVRYSLRPDLPLPYVTGGRAMTRPQDPGRLNRLSHFRYGEVGTRDFAASP